MFSHDFEVVLGDLHWNFPSLSFAAAESYSGAAISSSSAMTKNTGIGDTFFACRRVT